MPASQPTQTFRNAYKAAISWLALCVDVFGGSFCQATSMQFCCFDLIKSVRDRKEEQQIEQEIAEHKRRHLLLLAYLYKKKKQKKDDGDIQETIWQRICETFQVFSQKYNKSMSLFSIKKIANKKSVNAIKVRFCGGL